jgi:hypothetical protein
MPEMRFVGTAHEETLAIRDNWKCRDLITLDWFQALWPIEMAADLNGKREFGKTKKCFRQARTFTSMIRVRGDRVILDDPISADNATSLAALEEARLAFIETLPTRVNTGRRAVRTLLGREREVGEHHLHVILAVTSVFDSRTCRRHSLVRSPMRSYRSASPFLP